VPAAIRFISFEPLIGAIPNLDLRGIDWAIVGGESGPHARQMLEEWVDGIFEACRRANTEFFFKQWGGVNKKKTGRLYKGAYFDAMPAL
jgi:protein gp37